MRRIDEDVATWRYRGSECWRLDADIDMMEVWRYGGLTVR
jgi:hypothetical protein